MYMTPGTSGPIGKQSHTLPRKTQPAPRQKMRGLGDLVAWGFRKVGTEFTVKKITKGKDCGCAARQEALNKAVPFNRKEEE